MSRLPAVRPRALIAALQRDGFTIDHQTGSHAVLYKEGRAFVTVPFHNRDLKRGTLHAILQHAGLSVDELLRLL